jgi:hypothetical protein
VVHSEEKEKEKAESDAGANPIIFSFRWALLNGGIQLSGEERISPFDELGVLGFLEGI